MFETKKHIAVTDGNVEENRNAISDLSASVDKLPEVPVGTIISWVMVVDKAGGGVADLPKGWMRCDGSVIPDGIWKGKRVPNLNGDRRFLRGGSDENVLTLEDDQLFDHEHMTIDSGSSNPSTLGPLYVIRYCLKSNGVEVDGEVPH